METQPKYKFGDWLQFEDRSPFKLTDVRKINDEYFYSGGESYVCYRERDLKIAERPKRKIKKRFYMMAYMNGDGEWLISDVPVDENFRDNEGDERYIESERKILENSPYIELDCEE
jgi:hypothetical protein